MLKKKYNKIISLSLLGIFFILILNSNLPKVRGVQDTLTVNGALGVNFDCWEKDEINVEYSVLGPGNVDVYIRNQSTLILIGEITTNIVMQEMSSPSGNIVYKVPTRGYYSVIIKNSGASEINLEYSIIHSPLGLMGLLAMIFVIVILIVGIISATIIITVILVMIRKKRIKEEIFQKVRIEQGEKDFLNMNQQKRQEEELHSF